MVDVNTAYIGQPNNRGIQPNRQPNSSGNVENPTPQTPPADPVDTYVPSAQMSDLAREVTTDFYREVLDSPDQYPHLLPGLTDVVTGEELEYPLEITPAMRQHVANLQARFPQETQTQRGTALLLLRSLVPSTEMIEVEDEEGNRGYSFGLPAADGGQEVRADDNRQAQPRVENGDLLPREILALAPNDRIGLCLEQSNLLASLLRAAGIEASVREVPGHAYVIATLDEETYRLDATLLVFERTNRQPNTDCEATAMHYSNEASAFFQQGRQEEALQRIDLALTLNPQNFRMWNNRGHFLASMGRGEEALSSYDRALELNPLYLTALENRAYVLTDLGRTEEARAAWEDALAADPTNADAQAALAAFPQPAE